MRFVNNMPLCSLIAIGKEMKQINIAHFPQSVESQSSGLLKITTDKVAYCDISPLCFGMFNKISAKKCPHFQKRSESFGVFKIHLISLNSDVFIDVADIRMLCCIVEKRCPPPDTHILSYAMLKSINIRSRIGNSICNVEHLSKYAAVDNCCRNFCRIESVSVKKCIPLFADHFFPVGFFIKLVGFDFHRNIAKRRSCNVMHPCRHDTCFYFFIPLCAFFSFVLSENRLSERSYLQGVVPSRIKRIFKRWGTDESFNPSKLSFLLLFFEGKISYQLFINRITKTSNQMRHSNRHLRRKFFLCWFTINNRIRP